VNGKHAGLEHGIAVRGVGWGLNVLPAFHIVAGAATPLVSKTSVFDTG
jgi:hypothetical protein